MRLSYGSARFLGLIKSGPKLNMKTIYTMFGEKCNFDCAYCAQAKTSFAPENMLSRIVWPEFEMGEVVNSVEKSYGVKRVCLQVVSSEPARQEAFEFLAHTREFKIPISASVRILSLKEANEWFGRGVERLGVATDVVSKKTYSKYRGGDFQKHMSLLETLAKKFPNKITTHAIVGLGESEREMIEFIDKMHKIGISVGLFAFTPIKGTSLEKNPKPDLDSYRRIQIARYVLENDLANLEKFEFSENEEITSYGFDVKEVSEAAFLTSGCPNCTRPYYNENPHEESYNFFDKVKRTSFKVGNREV